LPQSLEPAHAKEKSMISRRSFLATPLIAGAASVTRTAAAPVAPPDQRSVRVRPGGHDSGYDPWIEIDAGAFRHNVREVSRLAGGRPVLAVVKNNAYGLGDTVVGPLLASCAEVAGVACVRPAEALAMRKAGVTKPILIMSEVSEEEGVELAASRVTLSCWLDDSAARLERIARRARTPVAVHLYLDTGMNREGMSYRRALPWIEDLAGRKAVRIDGTYHMFTHDLEFDRVQHARFLEVTAAAQQRGVRLGTLHAAPTFELFHLPESHLDMVRVANALCGNYPGPDVRDRASLKPVFRLKARVTRVDQLQPGDSAGFRRGFMADTPLWIALLPVGHTDGFPITAAGTCQALINGRLYPVVKGGVASAHTIINVGAERRVDVGDTATLIGGDAPEIDPLTVASNTGLPLQQMITKFSALLPRRLV
jgi:alanine racemase